MKLGIFDSGLGGLLIAKAIKSAMPDLDLIYFGDTLHLPYGNRSSEQIYEYSRKSVEFLFEQDSALIIIACNTASTKALRRLQQEYLPKSPYSKRRILGVVVPTLEEAKESGFKNIGLIGTNYTVGSNAYEEELSKIDEGIKLHQIATPLLVPMIENEGMQWIEPVLSHYLAPLKKQKIEALILGCTHYACIKTMISNIMGSSVKLISQDEIIPHKLADYLERHPEINATLERNKSGIYCVSDITESYRKTALDIFGADIKLQLERPFHE